MSTCELYTDKDRDAWQGYVGGNPRCGIYHDIGWKGAIEDAYGHEAPYLLARRNGVVTGVLPLVLTRSRLFGAALTSLPFLDYAGVAADDDAAAATLLERASELGRDLGVDYVEVRQLEPLDAELETSTHKVLMTLALDPDEDSVWKNLSSERRNRVRRAMKSGLCVEQADNSQLNAFYDIWVTNMRDLGSPPHSKAFFERVLAAFPGRSSLLMVRHEGKYIGAALSLCSSDTMVVPWVSSLREHFKLYPNNILYWEAMRIAVEKGLSTFDFGRSTEGSGTFQFKQRWGAVPTTLYWQRRPIGSGVTIDAPSTDGKYQRAVEIWKRLPVPVTRWIGPALRKNITA